MWKLLPVFFLVSCAAVEQQESASDDKQAEQGRIVRQFQTSLESVQASVDGQPSRRAFQGNGVQGWLDGTGAWNIRAEVHHRRLRCGVYETGIQVGRGNPGCSNVEWLTGIEYGTRLRHCNSASRVHGGGGLFTDLANRLEEMTCARVVVRCEGTC